jgi:KDO2-lipid IV(A) lauroyltransferase
MQTQQTEPGDAQTATSGVSNHAARTVGATPDSSARARARRWSLTLAGTLLDGMANAVRLAPVSARYALSDSVVWALGPLLGRPRREATRNFARVVGPERAAEAAERSLKNYGRMAMDFLASRTISAEEILALTDGRGQEGFRAATALGRGVIFALPHAGCWDVAAAFAQAYGCQLTIVTESDWGTELVAGSRRAQGVKLAPRNQSLRALFRALRRQECVVMLSDYAPHGVQTAQAPFFGAPAPFPLGPARLALATGAPVLVIMCVRTPGGRYLLEAQEPLYPTGARDSEEASIAMTAQIAAGFERIVRAYPEQWYPYHPVWPATSSE